jgi:gliding motility-associated-like protein
MKSNYLRYFFPVLLLLLLSGELFATHIRAGEITAVRINCQSLTYRFTITAYTDTRSPVTFGNGIIDFGDGSPGVQLDRIAESSSTTRFSEDNVAVNRFVVTHTFPSIGDFVVSYKEQNRNPGVMNMTNSVNTPFYIETKIVIDPFLGCNNTPILLIPPIDKAAVGVKFLHNPGAYDADGDSLSFKLVFNKQDKDRSVDNYVYPNHPRFGGSREDSPGLPIFTLDPIEGDLIWDSPGMKGEYNCAFIIEEWRKIHGEWFSMGYVTRDMQILVDETDNDRPELIVPKDTCIEAGTKLKEFIRAIDPNGDNVRIEAYGGPFRVSSSPATFSPNPFPFLPSPAVMNVEWQTNCSHVRERPYTFHFKVVDKPPVGFGPALVDFKAWNVTVVAPAPTGLIANQEQGRSMKLQWDKYECGNAEKMQIWRRVGSYDFKPEGCEIGMPSYAGYRLIGEVPINMNGYIDNNGGKGLDVGANYCYRLVAVFPQPLGGESYASAEACNIIEVTAPVITNVSIEKTDVTDGEILVKWTPPYDLDPVQYPPPYTYEIVRARGATGNAGEIVVARIADTLFIDKGINTRNEIFNYKINLYDNSGTNQKIVTSATASTVRLELTPAVGNIVLNWRANVPWTNQSPKYPLHHIYRDNVNPADPVGFYLIDKVNVVNGRFRYEDDGRFNNTPLSDLIEYNYFVVTEGTYENLIIDSPLLNKSQITGAHPNDEIPPCTPVSFKIEKLQDCRDFVKELRCDFRQYQNRLEWKKDEASNCDDDIRDFRIYYSATGDDNYELIATVTDTEFIHENLTSLAGCYIIAAVDRSGNESILSDKLCVDNCPHYELPNVFTPNGDNINDVFAAYPNTPDKCPRFVKSVKFKVYNRWGGEVFNFVTEGENSILINWDGRDNMGRMVPDGAYYYLADVEFIVLDPDKRKKTYNGWIQIMR